MTPQKFIHKWQGSTLNERQSYQAHFADLCALVGVDAPTPASVDNYCYERGVAKTGSKHGWADVWKRGCFAIEYKAPERNLDAALKQLMTYALALENPPLLVVCDTQIIQIHTHFTNAPSEVHTLAIADLAQPENIDKLRWLFIAPDKFHPQRTITQITEAAAGKFAALAQSLNKRGHEPQVVAHFLNQCLFCLFAEDAKLLPEKLFERLLDKSQTAPEKLTARLQELFSAMRQGGDFALEDIHWFNGGLFEKVQVLPLETAEIKMLHEAAKLDWSGIEPSIFGTLFERGLDPKKRSQLGAHYTDPQSILRIINPVIVEPLNAEWADAKHIIAEQIALYEKGGKGSKVAMQQAQRAFITYLERLKNFRVLDPACGSGNFLYVALRALKDLEHRANLDAEALGLQRQITIECSPVNVLGIELNPYAAELARVTVWIGEIQWMLKSGYPIRTRPILQPLDHIENRDAVLQTPSNSPLSGGEQSSGAHGASHISSSPDKGELEGVKVLEAEWPTVDVIIGNPPFLGGSKMLRELGEDYVHALRVEYEGRVPGGADLVTYWFEKARAQIAAGKCQRAGLVATQSIRKGSNQKVLARILNTPRSLVGEGLGESGLYIFNAWSDEEWINDGAAVRVSLVCFGHPLSVGWVSPILGVTQQAQNALNTHVGLRDKTANPTYENQLNGLPVTTIHADLTAGEGLNLTQAKPLKENAGVAFEGTKKYGDFDIAGELARQWLTQPNPNGKPNSDVLRPWANGQDITSRPSDTWIIDFGAERTEHESALYEIPFAHVFSEVKAKRKDAKWWLHERPRPALRAALAPLKRYIVTPRVAKHRLFVWLDVSVLPDSRLYAIAREDDATFGVLSSRIHEVWALANASKHGDGDEGGRPTYNAKSCFETFPFPEGITPSDGTSRPRPVGHPLPQAGEGLGVRGGEIAAAAKSLNQLRNNWLNPPEWTDWVRASDTLTDRPDCGRRRDAVAPAPVGSAAPCRDRAPEEEKAGYPLRPVAKVGHEADLKKRTLTNLYNGSPDTLLTKSADCGRGCEATAPAPIGCAAPCRSRRPTWLDNAHKTLDAAVAQAYGWNDYTPDMPDEEILRRLLVLNLARSKE